MRMGSLTVTDVDGLVAKEDLFKEVNYFVTGQLDAKVLKLLNDGGATGSNYCMTSTTHVLCGPGFDDNECAEAVDLYGIPCVTQRWVVASVQLRRLASTSAYDSTANRLFSNMVAAITRVAPADRHRLYGLITYHGGQVHSHMTPATTHLICGSPTGQPYAKGYSLKSEHFNCVTPDWVLESLQAATLLDPIPYHPKLLVKQKTLPSTTQTKLTKQSTPATSTTPTVNHVEPMTTVNSTELDKQTLSSILGFDFDEVMDGKSELGTVDHDDMQVMQVPSSLPTQILQTQLGSQPPSVPSSNTPATIVSSSTGSSNSSQMARQISQPQQSQLSQQLQAPQQPMATATMPQTRQLQKQSSGTSLVRRNSGSSQIIATQASVQQQITAINQQLQQQQQQKLTNAANGNSSGAGASNSNAQPTTAPGGEQSSSGTVNPADGNRPGNPVQIITQVNNNNQQQLLLQQQQQIQLNQQQQQSQQPPHVILNQSQPPSNSGQTIPQMPSSTQQPLNQSQQQQSQLLPGQKIITQKHIINTSTAQGQQIIQHHLISQQQRQQQQLQQSMTATGNAPPTPTGKSKPVQFIHGNPQQPQQSGVGPQQIIVQQQQVSSGPQQVPQPQLQQQAQLQSGVQQVKIAGPGQQQQPNNGQQPHPVAQQKRIIITQQQFSQLNTQQQNQIMIINQAAGTQQIIGGTPTAIQRLPVVVGGGSGGGLGTPNQMNNQSTAGNVNFVQQQQPQPGQPSQPMQQQPQNQINMTQIQQQNQQTNQPSQQISANQQSPLNPQQQQQRLQFIQFQQQQQQQQQTAAQTQQQQAVEQIKMQLQQVGNSMSPVNGSQIIGGASTLINNPGMQQPALQQTEQMIGAQLQQPIPQQQHQIALQSPHQHQTIQIQGNNQQPHQNQQLEVGPPQQQQPHQQQQHPGNITNIIQIQGTNQQPQIQQIITAGQQQPQQQQPQKIQIQNQIIVQSPNGAIRQQANISQLVQQSTSPQQQQQPQQQWTPQSPIQQQQQQQPQLQTGQSPTQSQQPQFQRVRPPWPPGSHPRAVPPGSERQIIHLDAQTHAHLQTLDPVRRAEYLHKLQKQRNERMLRQQVFAPRQGAPNGQSGASVRPTQHIIVRNPMPAGLTQQQQMQWLQQQSGRVAVLRGAAPGLSPISQSPGGQQQPNQPSPSPSPFPIDPRLSPQQQQQQQIQMQLQRQQQMQRLQQMQQQQQQAQQQRGLPQQGQAVSPRGANFPDTVPTDPTAANGVTAAPPSTPAPPTHVINQQDPNTPAGQMNSKTKTALANMLSNRLGNNNGAANNAASSAIAVSAAGGVVTGAIPVGGNAVIMQDGSNNVVVQEPSAAGTLRMMTAQHNAALNQSAAGGPRIAQELVVLQQQQQQQQGMMTVQQQHNQQQRRTLGNLTNGPPMQGGQHPMMQQSQQQSQQHQQPNQMHQSPSQHSVGQPGGQSTVPHSPSNLKGPPFSPGRPPLPRPQFYGHNPNLKLPAELFLLGCTFFIVEYEELLEKEVPAWMELIRKHGGEIETFYCPRVTHVLCRTQRHGVVMQAIRDSKRCVTAYWLNDTIRKRQVLPPWQALHLPMPSTFGTQRPATRHIISISGFMDERERERIKQMVVESGAKLTPYLSKHNTVLICLRPEGAKFKRAKDWAMPVVNIVWLNDILLGNLSGMSQFDSAKYQQYNLTGPLCIDYGLVPHLMTAWKSPINLTQESHERVKRSIAEASSAEPVIKKPRVVQSLEQVPDEIVCTKRPADLGEDAPRVMFSQILNYSGMKRAVTYLGGVACTSPTDATHIVMSRLMRSYKLLTALPVVRYVLKSTWLVDSAHAGYFLPTEPYQWSSDSFQKLTGCNLPHMLTLPNRRQLFAGTTFYMTPSVRPSYKELQQLIELSGGQVERQRRSGARINEANQTTPGSYVILSCPDDLHLLSDLIRPGKTNRAICATEFVLSGITTQKVDLDSHVIQYTQ